jgi:hypothetical protein
MANGWAITVCIFLPFLLYHRIESKPSRFRTLLVTLGLFAGLYLLMSGFTLLAGWGNPVGELLASNPDLVTATGRSARGRGGIFLLIWQYWPYLLIGLGGLNTFIFGVPTLVERINPRR